MLQITGCFAAHDTGQICQQAHFHDETCPSDDMLQAPDRILKCQTKLMLVVAKLRLRQCLLCCAYNPHAAHMLIQLGVDSKVLRRTVRGGAQLVLFPTWLKTQYQGGKGNLDYKDALVEMNLADPCTFQITWYGKCSLK